MCIRDRFTTVTDSRFATSTLAWGAFGTPRDITTDSFGNIYVLDNSDRIFKLAPDGDLITKWGGCGTAEGKFGNASKIVIDDQDEIYVLDTFHMEPDIQVTDIRYSRVHVFDSEGKFLRRWGRKGNGGYRESSAKQGPLKLNPEEILSPADITVGTDGNVYIIDGEGMRGADKQGGKKSTQPFPVVIKYDKLGNYLGTPVLGQSEPSLHNHSCPNMLGAHSVLVDGAGNIYVGGSSANFYKFDSNGVAIAGNSCPTSLIDRWGVGYHVNQDGEIFFAGVSGPAIEGAKYVVKYDADGEEILGSDGVSQLSFGSSGVEQKNFSGEVRLHADSDENLYIADIGNRKILKFDSAGEFEWEYKSDTNATWKRIGSKGAKEGEFNTCLLYTSDAADE